jgi:S1-C subfamily serine protease
MAVTPEVSAMPEPNRRDVLAGTAALLGGLAGCGAPSADADGSNAGDGNDATAEGSPYAEVYRETADAVVLIRSGRSTGTGFLYDDTHIVTNAHVVADAESVDVRFREGQWRGGSVRGREPFSDLAVVTVEDPPEFAESIPLVGEPAGVGEEVVAIGNPFGLSKSVSAGIVSGTDRLIPSPGGLRIPDAVQTDAAVNPGNSGGPLVTTDGEVAAVVNSGSGETIAFGISAALTRRVVPALVEDGAYSHYYVGATFRNVTPALAAANDIAEPRGVMLVRYRQESPAQGVLRASRGYVDAGGTRAPVGGDVILSVNGEDVRSPEDFRSHLALNASPGETVAFEVLRDGEVGTIDFELGERPPPAAFQSTMETGT